MSMPEYNFSFWRQIFGLDMRSLALMRVLSALVILADLCARISHLSAHYGIGSVFPPELMDLPKHGSMWPFLKEVILFFPQFPIAVFIVAFIAAAFVLIGYKTRLATPLLWLSILAIQNMNPLVDHGGDVYMRLVLLIAIFLPWGDYFSADRALSDDKPVSTRVVSVWTFALLSQISLIYLSAGLYKTIGYPWQEGTAVYLALTSYYATHFGIWLREYAVFLTLLTSGVRLFQLSIPFLLFSPAFNRITRTLAMVLLMAMHLIFTLCLNLGTFSFTAMAMLSSLVPSEWWQYLGEKSKRAFGSLTIYYDGDCGFCKKSSYLLREFLLLPDTSIRVAQTEESIYADMKKHDSWVVVNDRGERSFTYSAGVMLIAHSPPLFFLTPFMKLRLSRSIGERVYRWIADHRSRVCRPKSSGIPVPEIFSKSLPLVSSILGLIFIVSITLWNYGNLFRIPFPSFFLQMGETLGFSQKWALFAPKPVSYNGWNTIEGILANGRHVNVFDPDAPLTVQPPYVYRAYGSDMRWLKYFEAIDRGLHNVYLPYAASYFCRSWNATHTGSERLDHVTIIFTTLQTTPSAEKEAATSTILASRDCS